MAFAFPRSERERERERGAPRAPDAWTGMKFKDFESYCARYETEHASAR
jgi:hypothetical protein